MNGTHKEPDRFHGRALPHRLAAWTEYLHNTLLLSLPNSFLAVFCCSLRSAHSINIYGSNKCTTREIGVNFVVENITNI